MRLLLNDHPAHGTPLPPAAAAIVDASAAEAVERHLTGRPDHAPTQLVALPGLASELGIGALHVKDESARLGLGSFKALGGSWTVARLVAEAAAERLGQKLDVSAIDVPEVREIAASMTFACATDGNHGRSVAAAARKVGARAVVFVHEGVSRERIAAIERFGATVHVVPGTYDDAVAEAARRSAAEGWTLLSDTSETDDPDEARVPGLVMQGYTALVREALRELPEPPTHVFVQAGVGGLAAAVAGHLFETLGDRRPRVVVVEPARAACVLACAQAGRPIAVPSGEPTVMAMLECYRASGAAWSILAHAADAFMTVEDDDAVAAMRRLARPVAGDPAIVAGESGAAGLAGLLRAAGEPAAHRPADEPPLRDALCLDGAARVLVINTEGATDPGRYRELVGS